MTYGYIYKIAFPNGKNYIGLTTTSLKRRKKEHKSSAKRGNNNVLYKALRKHKMEDTFELIEIDSADTQEELCKKEIYYIQQYDSYFKNGKGYNMTYGGEGTFGYEFTTEDRQKMSEVMKKHYENPEARKKMSEAKKKHCENPEARKKMSEVMKKYYQENPESRQKQSEVMKKHYENPEARQKMSEAKKKHFENPEARQKQSEVMKKIFQNPKAKLKHSEAQKKRFENPEERIKRLNSLGQNKPFDVFKIDGTFIKTFTYQFEAREYLQEELNITTTIKIGEVLCGRQKTSAGFKFKYKE